MSKKYFDMQVLKNLKKEEEFLKFNKIISLVACKICLDVESDNWLTEYVNSNEIERLEKYNKLVV